MKEHYVGTQKHTDCEQFYLLIYKIISKHTGTLTMETYCSTVTSVIL